MKKKTNKAEAKVPAKKTRKIFSVNYEKFVAAWKGSDNLVDVGKKLDIKPSSCSSIASRLRAKGVKLKKFPKRPPQSVDVDRLNKIGK